MGEHSTHLTISPESMLLSSLVAGGLAGTYVDIVLYPLDTLKTRLQSRNGFFKSGGFKGLYKGILPVFIGSAPTAASFFLAYESCKYVAKPMIPETYSPLVHMGASSLAEIVACLIRVPVETVKQRKQALIIESEGISLKLLYRGYWSTVFRDMPFSLIQFPLWESFKKIWTSYVQRDVYASESAICGAVSGGIAAMITTPLDVTKTRIILANDVTNASEISIYYVLRQIYKEEGIQRLFSGIIPRTMWITLGGFIFFGVYEKSKEVVLNYTFNQKNGQKSTAICL